MAQETKNDMAVTQVAGALGSASHLSKFITNKDDAKGVFDTAMHLVHKIAKQHGFVVTPKPEGANRALRS